MSESLIQQVNKLAADTNSKVEHPRKGETFIEVEQGKVNDFISRLVNEAGVRHLSTISGLDLDQTLAIVYHFFRDGQTVHVKAIVPKDSPNAKSIVEVVPGAILYEMEVHDMFGIMFDGNPWMDRKLLLPDIWPTDLPPPLLKTAKPEEIRKRLELESK